MKKKILWIGDGVVRTGFGVVNHNIIANLNKDIYDIHHLAINYYGDPHEFSWKIYPAVVKGDIWGFNRIKDFSEMDWDGIFILNDLWVVKVYLDKIKESFKKIPPIVVYSPVDSMELSKDWFTSYNMVSKLVLYTQFGYDEVRKVEKDLDLAIIQHGVDLKTFYKIDAPKSAVKKTIYPDRADFYDDSFIILSASRNQPRKRLDILLEGFKLFSDDKPDNVKLYVHAGTVDVGCNLLELAERLKIDNKIIFTNLDRGPQKIPDYQLNFIYNGTDVGINTSLGEGWSLTNHEHAITGAPQIVPDHSACRELYKDCGILIPVERNLRNLDNLTISGLVSPEGVAKSLQTLFENKELYNKLSMDSIKKFSADKYKWDNIVKTKWEPLFSEIY